MAGIRTASLLLLATACAEDAAEPRGGAPALRVGHFANVTHAHALVARELARSGEGWFEPRVGVPVEWSVHDAGPSAMEALVAGSLDLAYVGPSPAINAHLRSLGRDVFVVAGAVRGGAALVVRPDRGLREAADFRGRRIATPQLGNTQDVACRAWLVEHGLRVTQVGGDALVVPTHNPDQLVLFQRGDIDAAWTVEPWVSRIEREAGGQVLLEQTDDATTVLVASAKFLAARRDVAARFVAAHRELGEWLAANPDEAQRRLRDEFAELTRRPLAAELVAHCWPRLRFDAGVEPREFAAFAAAAQRVGFLRHGSDLGRFVERLP
jgi:NitT/TauT family transport system substrate-binding protein